ncbi:non-homologous end-joining DNA ligase [Thermoactinomyces sp. CICC 10521]
MLVYHSGGLLHRGSVCLSVPGNRPAESEATAADKTADATAAHPADQTCPPANSSDSRAGKTRPHAAGAKTSAQGILRIDLLRRQIINRVIPSAERCEETVADERYVQVEGVELKISNPDKMLFPQARIRKWDFIMACARLAPYLLKYCRNRLLTTIRFPDGVGGESFFQKNAPSFRPSWIETYRSGEIDYILLNQVPSLIWLANLAALEFHVSFHTAAEESFPTELVFDIDPSIPDFSKVVEVALLTRQVLNKLNLDGIAKTSGATGLQIYVPIEPVYTYEQTRRIGEMIARYLTEQHPALVTIERRVEKRGDKVYFDYLQHWHNKTLIAPYSPRAVPEATVSTPLQWDEVTEKLSPKTWTLHTIFSRLEEKGDLFAPIYGGERYRLDEILRFLEQHRL